jgi:antibiotic biosynthesis monooxygenase (ABM) superfamily enzyme
MDDAPLVFINCFQVPPGQEQRFLNAWDQIDAYMVNKPGYLWNRLPREEFDAAHDDEYRTFRQNPDWEGITATPALYTVFRAAEADSTV